jgi:glycosidase
MAGASMCPTEVETEGFWQEFRDRIKAVNPEAYIVGEIWTEAVSNGSTAPSLMES